MISGRTPARTATSNHFTSKPSITVKTSNHPIIKEEIMLNNHLSKGAIMLNENKDNKNLLPKQRKKCIHNALFPKMANITATHKRRPHIIEQAKTNLLNSYTHTLGLEIGRIHYHQDKNRTRVNNAFRKRRSQIRESLSHKAGLIILHYCNLAKMQLGMLVDGKFRNFGIEFIMEKTGLSYSRIRSALAVYENYHYVTITENKHLQPDGTYRSTNATITVHKNFFLDLGVDEKEFDVFRDNKLGIDRKAEIYAKAHEYIVTQREVKKSTKAKAKKEFKSIGELLRRSRSGDKLTQEESDELEKEYPGYKRNHNQGSVSYRDYTGCAGNREMFNEPKPASSEVASYHLKEILANLRLKPPS
jgi:hypothetical protein